MGQWQSQPLCNTPACVHTSANILQNLHPQWKDMDPCTDFGEMVCYGFKQHKPADMQSLSYAARDNRRILQTIFESPNHDAAVGIRSSYLRTRGADHDEHNFDMLHSAFKTCMDTATVEAEGSKPLTDFIVSINETWPATDFTSKVGSDYDGLLKATLMLEELGIPTLHSNCQGLSILANPWASDKKLNHPCLSLPRVSLPSKSYTDPTQVKGLVARYAQAYQMLYPALEMEAVMGLAEAVVAFEADIAKLLLPLEQERDPADVSATLKQVSLAEANAAAPALNLEKMLTALAGKKPSTVLLDIPSFWPKYSEVISKTPKAAIHGLLAFKAAAALVGHVESSELRKLFPASTSKERGLDCVDSLTDFMASELVDSYFIRAAYNEQSLKAVDKMATNVIAAFKKRVGELEWLGAESRKRAVKKVENIVRNIGHRTDEAANPDPMSGESLATYYRDLNITTGSHFANSLGGMRVKTAKAFAQVDLPIDRKSFLLPVSGPNAAYYMAANSINIPAGITQLPAFHHQLPSYVLYGGVGSIIGHEITHGFDSNGRKWDENAAHSKWWDDESSNKFDDLSQCFIEQYNAYEVDVPSGKANVNGNITLAENISDAGGLRAAYEAWLAERKAMPSAWDQDLPGLDMFTHEQLFFIMWGNNWCSSYSAAGMEDLIKTDNHAPATARLGLTAQNSGAFKEAFKCKNKKPACEIF